ncbi:MAG TPA: penicillin acylase family protein [Anaerolineales bacterium]|nr:penicillin acylase family protein [Anaerolineales bacterium]
MQPRRRPLGRTVLLVVLMIVVVLGLAGVLTVRRSFPRTDGSLNLPGLHAQVEVLRDALGVPQIYAQDEHDLFMAQGFVHAQDRFWQMDFWRHLGSGRLAEMFGESQVETDAFIRTMGWPRLAEAEYAAAEPEIRAVLEAYAAGVNAYIEQRQGAALSLEYAVLGLINSGYELEPWTPIHSLTWAKAMSYDLSGNADAELRHAILAAQLGDERVADLLPAYPDNHPVIVEGFGGSATTSAPIDSVDSEAFGPMAGALTRFENLNALTGGAQPGLGSNNWVIGPERTTTGGPLLANDPHLSIRIPSIWYAIGLHCECGYNVIGSSFAGLPGVVFGHNERIAWGVTNVGPDVQDLFLERINPDNPLQYELDGEWIDMTVREEVIHVAGSEPQTITVRETRHGPVLSDAWESGAAFAESASSLGGETYAISFRWTALEPSRILQAALGLNRAENWDDFRQALRDWDVPSQNFVYADVDGNIGYQMPGKIPVRSVGTGTVPISGWLSANEWTGYVPFDELPNVYNPSAGFVVTANNAVVGADYPHLITTRFDLGYRAARIVELIEAAPQIDAEAIRSIHGDNFNPAAPALAPVLLGLDYEAHDAPELAETISLLDGWDYQNDMDSPEAALFNAVWRHTLLRTFADELPDNWIPDDDLGVLLTGELLATPGSTWWDDLQTSIVEMRDATLVAAVQDALAELRDRLGDDPAKWTWGGLHGATFENETLGRSGIGPIEALFNRGPFPTSGGSAIVNATGWAPEVDYAVRSAPSERVIMDPADWDRSLWIHTTGQSGHAFHPHYIDMADLWRSIQYAPMLWTRAAIEAAAEERLVLTP